MPEGKYKGRPKKPAEANTEAAAARPVMREAQRAERANGRAEDKGIQKIKRHLPMPPERFATLPMLLPLSLYVLVSVERAMPFLMQL